MTDHTDALLIERPDRLQLYRFDELVNRPPAPWQIRGVLREQSVSLLYGRRGCYKSFVALDLAACLATGIPWQTHEVKTQGLVIYVAGEGGGGMVQRARAWVEQHSLTPSEVNVRFVTEPVQVTATSDDMDILIQRIKDAIYWQDAGFDEETGHDYPHPTANEWPALIVIDTLARCFLGDENATEDMGMFVQGVDRLKQEFNTSVLIIHHTGRDESHERGNTALGSACDTIYRLDAEEGSLTLTNEKMKDSAEPAPILLTCKVVQVSRRAVDDPDEELTSVIIEGQNTADNDQKDLWILDFIEQKGHLKWIELAENLCPSKMSLATLKRRIGSLSKSRQIIKKTGYWELFRLT